jgi:hypothetical protein
LDFSDRSWLTLAVLALADNTPASDASPAAATVVHHPRKMSFEVIAIGRQSAEQWLAHRPALGSKSRQCSENAAPKNRRRVQLLAKPSLAARFQALS